MATIVLTIADADLQRVLDGLAPGVAPAEQDAAAKAEIIAFIKETVHRREISVAKMTADETTAVVNVT